MSSFLSFQLHGNSSGGVANGVERFLTFVDGLLSQSPYEIFTSLMPGISALANTHPLVVHFPIAFLSGFILIDLIASLARKQSWRDVASWFLYFGTVTALLTVIAGFVAEASVPHGGDVHAVMEQHELFGIAILSLSAFLSLWRWLAKTRIKAAANILYGLLSLILGGCIILGADLGGLMVYKYGVAVEAVSKTESLQEAFHEHKHGH